MAMNQLLIAAELSVVVVVVVVAIVVEVDMLPPHAVKPIASG